MVPLTAGHCPSSVLEAVLVLEGKRCRVGGGPGSDSFASDHEEVCKRHQCLDLIEDGWDAEFVETEFQTHIVMIFQPDAAIGATMLSFRSAMPEVHEVMTGSPEEARYESSSTLMVVFNDVWYRFVGLDHLSGHVVVIVSREVLGLFLCSFQVKDFVHVFKLGVGLLLLGHGLA